MRLPMILPAVFGLSLSICLALLSIAPALAQTTRQPACQTILLDRLHSLNLLTTVGVATALGPYSGGFASNDQIRLRNNVGAGLVAYPVDVTFRQGATQRTFTNVAGGTNISITMGAGGFNTTDALSIEVTPRVSADHAVEIECNPGAGSGVGGGSSSTTLAQAGAAGLGTTVTNTVGLPSPVCPTICGRRPATFRSTGQTRRPMGMC